MDIFKTLTRGSKFKSTPAKAPEVAKASACTAGKLPEALDFFADPQELPCKEEDEDLVGVEEAGKASKRPFKNDDALKLFREKHNISLTLYETSAFSGGSAGAQRATVPMASIRQPDQVLPARSFEELVARHDLDGRLVSHMSQVYARESAENAAKQAKATASLLTDVDGLLVPLVQEPTAVQMQGTPVILTGRDCMLVAPTGSGKTLAFILGSVGRLLASKPDAKDAREGPLMVVLSPTKELAEQITTQFIRFMPQVTGKKDKLVPLFKVTNLGKSIFHAWASDPASRKRSPILVSTPQRIVEALKAGLLDMSAVRVMVLDEVDRLLAGSFTAQIDEILHAGLKERMGAVQKILVSATMPSNVEEAALSILTAPYKVFCGQYARGSEDASEGPLIQQELIYCGQGGEEEGVGKVMALRQLITQGRITAPALIFAGSTERAERLTAALQQLPHMRAGCLHSGVPGSRRAGLIDALRTGQLWFLVTTDVLARGLDCPAVSCVVNYDFPDSTATYIHRIGRTGRAGRRGNVAFTLYTAQDVNELRIVVNVMKQSGCAVPEWLATHFSKGKGPTRLQRKLRAAKKAKAEPQ